MLCLFQNYWVNEALRFNSTYSTQLLIYSCFWSAEFKKDFPGEATYFKDNNLKRFTLLKSGCVIWQVPKFKTQYYLRGIIRYIFLKKKKDEICNFLFGESNKMTVGGISDLSKHPTRLQLHSWWDTDCTFKVKDAPSILGQIEYSEELLELLKVLANHIVVSIFRVDLRLRSIKKALNRLIQNFGKFTTTQKWIIC
jgi:hypothetical protein